MRIARFLRSLESGRPSTATDVRQNAEDILNKTTNLTVPDWDEIRSRIQQPDFGSPPSSRTAGPLAMTCPADPLTTSLPEEHPWLGRLNVCSTEFDVAAAWNGRGKRNIDSGWDAPTDAEMRPRL
jgi:hypothetical protein